MAVEAYAGSEWIKGGKQAKAPRSFFQPEILDRELVRNAGESGSDEKREADYQETALRRRKQREEHAEMHKKHLSQRNTMAALPVDQFESLKDAAFEKIPQGMRSTIPEGTHPLKHGVWESFMWREYEKRNAKVIEPFEGRLQ